MSLHSNLPLHAPSFAWPRVTHGAGRGCVRGALPGCASPVLAIGGAHLLSVPRSRAGPVGAAQSDRVPGMASRQLVASALIRRIVKLPVRSLRRRHLHPYPCRLPSRSGPARCHLLHDFAHTVGRGEAFTPVAPGRPSHPHPEIESPQGGSSHSTDELLPTIHAIVASSPSLLRVALLTAASPGDFYIHHLATFRTERHRRISTPMIPIGTQTLRHEPLSPLQ